LSALPVDARDVLQELADSALCLPLEQALGPAPWCDIDQSWLRHGRPPHSWHQDGALRHDFLAHAGRSAPADAALEMRTLWIALTPCGRDAPGLQWVDTTLNRLLSPAELTAQAVAGRFGSARLRHPELAAGQALLFDGLLLHRTHLTPDMRGMRASLELRFFRADAKPARVAGDAGLPLTSPSPGPGAPPP
jgi:ectoine hydroxylase-related dioxygenase (phytanoyl-CoA dioxygenase family)